MPTIHSTYLQLNLGFIISGKQGVWAYVEGGMGAVSAAIASAAQEAGAELLTDATVRRILYADGKVTGVKMEVWTSHSKPVPTSSPPPHIVQEEVLQHTVY